MAAPIEYRSWDSEFFGVEIGRVELGPDTTAADLDAIDVDAACRSITCLYASVDPTGPEPSHMVQARDFRLVEVAILLERSADAPLHRPPTESTCRWGTPADLAELDASIARLAPWSRFAMDPRFGLEAAERLMAAWVGRAAAPHEDRHRLAVAEDASGITGFLTVVLEDKPVVDLAVTTRPAAGAAPALMAFALDECGHAARAGPMAARNTAVGRYTSHFGYYPIRTRYLFHKWYD